MSDKEFDAKQSEGTEADGIELSGEELEGISGASLGRYPFDSRFPWMWTHQDQRIKRVSPE